MHTQMLYIIQICGLPFDLFHSYGRAEQMERFNGLYLNKLETRLLASATSLAHIDRLLASFGFFFLNLCLIFHCHISSNVKNLQERAHVWDTFQLHVSAWNEQIKSVDKKLDILSRSACL